MSNVKKSLIIKKGNEYHVLVDDEKNIYNENMFFYPVYKKSADILEEICNLNSQRIENGKKELAGIDFCTNNLIMYCAERGGGKSSAMRTFANLLRGFEDEKEKDCFTSLFSKNMKKYRFSVLKEIDPTAISSKDLFMRVILSRMFKELRDKLEDKFLYRDESEPDSLVSMFTECYRLLDVIYQKGGDFNCDDDLDDLSDLGDSCLLKDKFSKLIQNYLRIIIGNNNCENNFLIIQIDDADLNSEAAYGIIEDIRKYCIVPNVIILMALNMKQMRYVLDQHFAAEFKSLLDASYRIKEEIKPMRLLDCQKMAARYIDKIMPIGHQIHLPSIDDEILNHSSGLTIEYYDENGKDILNFPPNEKTSSDDYQEKLLRFIYTRIGIPFVKTTSYLHNFLPKTMRGLSHFLAYIGSLEELDLDYGIAEIDMLCREELNSDELKKLNPKKTLSKSEAEEELKKRKKNIDLIEQYFLTNWCPIRLDYDHKLVIENIAAAANDQKILSAVKWLEKLYEKYSITNISAEPELSDVSYAYLLEVLRNISDSAHIIGNAEETYRFTYALRFYFTLFFNRLILLDIKEKNEFKHVLSVSNYEVWEPVFENANNNLFFNSWRFRVDSDKWNKYIDTDKNNEKILCIMREKKVNYPIFQNITNPNANIIFDYGTFLLLFACDKIYDAKIDDSSARMKYLSERNFLLILLFNWDIQHCAEKTDFLPNSSKGATNDLRVKQPLDSIFNCVMTKLNYLGITFDETRSDEIFKTNDVKIFKGEVGLVDKDAIKQSVDDLKGIFKNIDTTSINAGISELAQLYTSITIIDSIKELKIWSNFSNSAKEIVSSCDSLYNLLNTSQKVADPESFMTTIKKLISTIQNNLDVQKIIDEIKQSYD